MKVTELRKELKSMNVEFPARAKKAELEALLEAAEIAVETEALLEAVETEAVETEESLTAEQRRARGHARQAISQKASMEIPDRSVVNVETGEVFKNSSAVWKAEFVSSSQCDTLSGKLLGAFKKDGSTPKVTVNGIEWQLGAGYKAESETAPEAPEADENATS